MPKEDNEDSISPQRWQQIEKLFQSALKRDSVGQAAFLEYECGGDSDLKERVAALLDADQSVRHQELFSSPLMKFGPVPSQLSHYQIVKKLGAGGMGEVYLAKDDQLDRLVALKILPDMLMQDAERIRRFLIEARAASAINHSNVAHIYEIGEADGVRFIAMEYIDGQTLDTRLKLPFSLNETVEIGIQICKALEAAHAKGIIHRDLKPANIMVTPEGQIKLLDFGLAKIPLSKDPNGPNDVHDSTHTAPGILMGTVPYMSPEQLLGKKIDYRTDFYSFGIVLYQLVTGRLPFEGRTTIELADAILHKSCVAPKSLNNTISDDLSRIILKLMAKEPDDRFGNAREIRTAVEQLNVPKKVNRRRIVFASIILAAVLIAAWFTNHQLNNSNGLSQPASSLTKSFPTDVRRLAVLPLENLSSNPEQEYLADALTDELITTLSQIQSLRVISRTSVMAYKNVKKPLPKIASELNADAILEGSVLTLGNHIRITAQLIHGPSDQHLWAKTYERELGDVFNLLNEVSSSIAQEINVNLLPREIARFNTVATVQPDAYRAYLRGKFLLRPPDLSDENPRLAAQMFERAVKLHPDFALAYAYLSQAYTYCYRNSRPRDEALLHKAKAAIDQAFLLERNLPEGHVALGWYYYAGLKDYPRAVQEYSVAEKSLPGDAVLLTSIAAVYRRMGKFQEAAQKLKETFELSPNDARMAWDTGLALRLSKKYAEAGRYFDKVIALTPDRPDGYLEKIWNLLLWNADVQGAMAILKQMPQTDHSSARYTNFVLHAYASDFESALHVLNSSPPPEKQEAFYAFLTGYVYSLTNRPVDAKSLYQKSYALLKAAAKEQEKSPVFHSHLGMVYAVLGKKEDAIREGKLGTQLLPVSADALFGPDRLEDMAFIYTIVGEHELALDSLEYLCTIPTRQLSVALIRIDQRWAPLRNHPRFQKLVAQKDVN